MQIIYSPDDLQKQCLAWRQQGKSIALVPTMGFLHEGHESLMHKARAAADKVVVTLFVNPTQFAPTEDLSSYPRDAKRDEAIAQKHGVDLLFAPKAEDMYGANHATWVEVPALSTTLCAVSRPTHFRGVCTVVAKLFLLAQPTIAFFGEKDWQQLAIIRRMVKDLNFPVEVAGVPIFREDDGLAKSSRNAYLTLEERTLAPHFNKGLQLALAEYRAGQKNCASLRQSVLAYWAKHLPQGVVDYCSFVDPHEITLVAEVQAPVILAAAIKLGKARLIDNILIA